MSQLGWVSWSRPKGTSRSRRVGSNARRTFLSTFMQRLMSGLPSVNVVSSVPPTTSASRHRGGRAHHIAQTSARAACRCASRPLLCSVEIYATDKTSAGNEEPLEYREPTALGARRSFLRGSQSSAKGPCARDSCSLAKAGAQHPANASTSGFDTPQNQTRRLGRRIPFAGNQPYAIALQRRGIRTTRLCRPHGARSSTKAHASIASPTNVRDDRDTPLWVGEDGADHRTDLRF